MSKNTRKITGFCAVAMTAFSVMASATDLQGVNVDKTVERDGKDLRSHTVIDQVITAEIDQVYTTYNYEMQQVPTVVCNRELGEGRGDWHDYFNVPMAEKPQALAAAIKGVGEKTAEKLVYGGYFRSKPRTWEGFKEEINRADAEFHTGISYKVLVQYGQDNMTNLGYYVAGACTVQSVATQVLVANQQTAFFKNESKNFEIIVDGGALLKMESESYVIHFDGFSDSITVNSSYNTYQMTRQDLGMTVVYRLSGNRVKATPPNTLSMTAKNEGGNLVIEALDQAFDADLGGNAGQTVVTVQVFEHRALWFPKQIASFEKVVNLNNQFSEIDTGFRPDHGKKVFLKYEMKKVGAYYYNANQSTAAQSGDVSF